MAHTSDGESEGAKKDGSDEEEDESGEVDDEQLQIMIRNFSEFETTNRSKTWLGKNTEAIFKEALLSFDKESIVLEEYSAQANVNILRGCVRNAFWKLYLVDWPRGDALPPKTQRRVAKSRLDSLMRFFSAKTDKSPKLRNIETWNTRLDSTLTAEAKRVHFQKHMYPIMLIKDIKSVEVQADGAHGCDENADAEKFQLDERELKELCRSSGGEVHKRMPCPITESKETPPLEENSVFVSNMGELDDDQAKNDAFQKLYLKKHPFVIYFNGAQEFSRQLRDDIIRLLEESGDLPLNPIWHKMELDPSKADNDNPLGSSTSRFDPARVHAPVPELQRLVTEKGSDRDRDIMEKLITAGYATHRKMMKCLPIDKDQTLRSLDKTMSVDSMTIIGSRNLPLDVGISRERAINRDAEGANANGAPTHAEGAADASADADASAGGDAITRSTGALPARGHNLRALHNAPKPSKTLQNDAVLRDCELYDSDDGRDWKETVEWVRVLNLPQDENTWTEKQFQTFFRAHKRACDQERQDRAASAKLERQIISELRQKFNLGDKEAASDSDSDGEGGGGRGEGAAAATDGSIRAVVSNGGGEGVAAELAAAATTRGEPDFISLECRTVGTKATVMLAQGLLVVRHLGGQCNVYSLASAMGVNENVALESLGPIPWGKAACLHELRKPVIGFWGAFGEFWGVRVEFRDDLDPLPFSQLYLTEIVRLPFIFRRLPLGCRLVARRQRLLAVLLSQHPRVGVSSPLRAVFRGDILMAILDDACPDPSLPTRTTGGDAAADVGAGADNGTSTTEAMPPSQPPSPTVATQQPPPPDASADRGGGGTATARRSNTRQARGGGGGAQHGPNGDADSAVAAGHSTSSPCAVRRILRSGRAGGGKKTAGGKRDKHNTAEVTVRERGEQNQRIKCSTVASVSLEVGGKRAAAAASPKGPPPKKAKKKGNQQKSEKRTFSDYKWTEPEPGVARFESKRQSPHMDLKDAPGFSMLLSLNNKQPFDVYPESGPGLELMRDELSPLYERAMKYYKEKVHATWAKWNPGRTEEDGAATYWCYIVHRLFVERGVPLHWTRKRLYLKPGHGVIVSNYILHGGAEYDGEAAYRIHWYVTDSSRLVKDTVNGIPVYNQVFDFRTDPIWFPIARYLNLEPSTTVDLTPRKGAQG
jgi:hypothetical protein